MVEEEAPVEADAAEVGEEEGNREENEKQDATSALLVSRGCVTSLQQKSLPTHAAIRHHPDPIETTQPPLPADLPQSGIPVGSITPFEPRLGDIPQTSDGRETPSHVESESCLPVKATGVSSQPYCAGGSNPGPSSQQKHALTENDIPTESQGPVGGGQLLPLEHLRALFAPGKKPAVTIAMPSTVGDVLTAEDRTM